MNLVYCKECLMKDDCSICKKKNYWDDIYNEVFSRIEKHNGYKGIDIKENKVFIYFKDGTNYDFEFDYHEHLIELLKKLDI